MWWTSLLFQELWIGAILAFFVGIIICVHLTLKPPPSKICGTPNGPPVTSPRIRLRDGRYLAYKARGCPRQKATYKLILSHGFHSSKEINLPLSDEWLQKMGIYLVTFDRPGYSESDPNPKRSPKDDALDIEELADELKLGSKFYLLGLSLGTYPIWGSLKYISHRLAGVALVVPVINYWWPSLPVDLCNQFYGELPREQKLRALALHYAPKTAWLLHKWFPAAPIDVAFKKNPDACFNQSDIEIMKTLLKAQAPDKDKILQQGAYESQHRDMIMLHGKWDFDPLELSNPFPYSEGHVQLWIGTEDKIMPPELQRQIVKKLPWIRCYELPEAGHLIIHDEAHCKTIFTSLLLGPNDP